VPSDRNSEFQIQFGAAGRGILCLLEGDYSETQSCWFISSLFFYSDYLLAADIATAQTIAYRQANLASNLSNVANNVRRAWRSVGDCVFPGQPFFLAENNVGG